MLLAVLGACTPTAEGGRIGGTVRVVASRSGAEEEAFMAVVAPFEEQTGIVVDYTRTRDLNGLLWEGVAKGRPPDVAGLPGPGQMLAAVPAVALDGLEDIAARVAQLEQQLGQHRGATETASEQRSSGPEPSTP